MKVKNVKRFAKTVVRRLSWRGWKILPKVWIEREDVEGNKGYFPRGGKK